MPRKRKKLTIDKQADFAESNWAEILTQATEDLYYISETDAEILPFVGTSALEVTREEILRQTGKSFDEKVEERDFEQFFERLTKTQDWFGEEEIDRAKKFAILKNLLLEKLKSLKVFKIGKIELEIYFVGLDEKGKLTGIKTMAVET